MNTRKIGQLKLTSEVLLNSLGLPKETHIKHIEIDPYRDLITIILTGADWLPDVHEGQEAPIANWPVVHEDYLKQIEEFRDQQANSRKDKT